jgi:hypothetical protein
MRLLYTKGLIFRFYYFSGRRRYKVRLYLSYYRMAGALQRLRYLNVSRIRRVLQTIYQELF